MSVVEPERPEDWQIEIGRGDGGKTFIRVVHLPTGITRGVGSIGDRGAEWMHWLVTDIRKEVRWRAVDSAELAEYASLWNGSEPGWCLKALHRRECRIVVLFEPPGATARDLLALRGSFDEYRGRPPGSLLKDVGGKTRFMIERVYDASEGPAAAQKAREHGLRVEEWARDVVEYLPVNEATNRAMIIEDDAVAAAVIEKMRACGVKVIPEARGE